MEKWTNEQMDTWKNGQINKLTTGQVDNWTFVEEETYSLKKMCFNCSIFIKYFI